MVKNNKYFIRVIAMFFYIIVISILLFLVSSLYTYLNTGADRSKMLHLEVKKIDQYLPKIAWAENGNEGRFVDDETLKNIENDYLDAWYVNHVSNKTNTTAGIEDYYTKNARKKIYDFIDENKKNNISIASTTINHNPDILFFSEDGQLIVLEDKEVIEYSSIYENDKFLYDYTSKASYKMMLLLEDGFWRIRHKIKENEEDLIKNYANVSIDTFEIKGINYYPQKTPWDTFGDNFDKDVLDKDFKLLNNANINTIRIFIPYVDFGKANVEQEKIIKLKTLLDIAETNNLKAVVTLFDFYGNYNVLDWTLNHRHAEAIVTNLKDHNAILAWDIKNEPDLDFNSRGKQNVIAWLEHMSLIIKSIDKKHPITIGWSNIESASILKDVIDFISFHYYEDVDLFEEKFNQLKKEIPNKKLVLGEYGLSSYSGFWRPFASSEEKQEAYHKKMQKVLTEKNISFMSWTLYDFDKVPKEVVGSLPWRTNPQKRFGFIDTKGNLKPSFKYISKQ